MDKVYRDSLNIEVAFMSAIKNQGASGASPSFHLGQAAHSETSGRTPRFLLFLRPVARVLFRLSKPFIRPIAYRTRTFLLANLQREMMHGFISTASEIRCELAEARRELAEMMLEVRMTAETTKGILHNQMLERKDFIRNGFDYKPVLEELRRIRGEIAGDTKDFIHNQTLETKTALEELGRIQAVVAGDTKDFIHNQVLETKTALEELGRIQVVVAGDTKDFIYNQTLNNKVVLDELSRIGTDLVDGTKAFLDNQAFTSKIVLDELDRTRIEAADGAKDFIDNQAFSNKALLDELGRLPAEVLQRIAPPPRVAVSCGSGEILIRTAVGFVLCPPDDPALLALLLETGDLEPGTRLLIERLVQPGDVFVDVGANIGMHSIAAGRAMQGKGRIVAFEPFKQTWLSLNRSLWINGFSSIASVYNTAVADRAGRAPLNLGATSGHHSLYALDVPAEFSSNAVEVELVTLDDLLAEDHVDFLKIDAEGAEIEIVAGATTVLSRNKNIALIVEFGPSHLQRSGQTAANWMSKFEEHGFSYMMINDFTGELSNTSVETLETMESANLFFARKESLIWQKTVGTL